MENYFSPLPDKSRSLHYMMEKFSAPEKLSTTVSTSPSSTEAIDHHAAHSDGEEKAPSSPSERRKNVYNETVQDIRDLCSDIRSFISDDVGGKKSYPDDGSYEETLSEFHAKFAEKQAQISRLWDECRGEDYGKVPALIPEVGEMQEVYAFLLRSLFGNVR